jgi:hypothetical protein
MAVRTTDENVRAILEVDTSITDLTPFIAMANELVTECCGASSIGYTATRLEMIERLLAAHFVCLRDMRALREKAGSVMEEKDTKLELGFNHTHHGQMALRMDTNGGLNALEESTKKGLRVPVSITWLGYEQEELDTT